MSQPQQNSASIEEAMQKLEALVGEMESGKLPLEKLLAHYEEGVSLVKLCQERLDAAEEKIQIIKRNASGPAGLDDFHSYSNES